MQRSERQTAVAILSGGLDSAVLVYYLMEQGYDVATLSFNYGQRHAKQELRCARKLGLVTGVHGRLLDITTASQILGGNALVDPTINVPEGHYADPSMALTVVPNRNAIMLSFAWGYAVRLKATKVAYGAHGGDHPIYPDCRPEFAQALQRAFSLGNEGFQDPSLSLLTPFIDITKADIVKLGNRLKVPFELTWSCYQGGELHCGKCGTCVERIEAFQIAGVPDPTIYETNL